jgi:hypothetical protein
MYSTLALYGHLDQARHFLFFELKFFNNSGSRRGRISDKNCVIFLTIIILINNNYVSPKTLARATSFTVNQKKNQTV